MKLEELKDDEMYVLVAPDGGIQLTTLAPNFSMCVAICELLSKKGISQPLAAMFNMGFEILPVKVSILQNGTSDDGFKKSKQRL